jgi:ATP-dependent DNA ligase
MIVEVFPVLLGHSKSGKMKEWRIYVEHDEESVSIVTQTGYVNGKKTEHRKEVKEGKNLGKSNETTHFEQAYAEAQSTWKDKITRGGYFQGHDSLATTSEKKAMGSMIPPPPTAASSSKSTSMIGGGEQDEEEEEEEGTAEGTADVSSAVMYPMLANKWTVKKTIEEETFVQPKLDGVRCMCTLNPETGEVLMLSRTGQPYLHLTPIRTAIEMLFKTLPKETMDHLGPFWLDGELYSHDIPFQKITSIVRKKKAEDKEASLLQYHIYDVYLQQYPLTPFADRFIALQSIESHIMTTKALKTSPLRMVETKQISPSTNLLEKHNAYTEEGYEGMMIRYGKGIYRPKYRSNDLLKYKLFEDHEYPIVGFKESNGIPGTIQFICQVPQKKSKDTITFTTDMMGTFESRKEMFEDAVKAFDKKMKGKKLTVQHQGYTDAGIPRFPKGKTIRDYE